MLANEPNLRRSEISPRNREVQEVFDDPAVAT
jgi:hypothetical protein